MPIDLKATDLNIPINRSEDELVERWAVSVQRDMFGFESGEYVRFFTFDAAKARNLVADGVTSEMWGEAQRSTIAMLSQEAKKYMSFWLEKIEEQRGLSVQRATMHYVAWKWLLRHPDADTFPGSVDGASGGYYQRDAYNYIKRQMDSGEWDAMTEYGAQRQG